MDCQTNSQFFGAAVDAPGAGSIADRAGDRQPRLSERPFRSFQNRADELAAWVNRHLVNRADAWGQYKRGGGVFTAKKGRLNDRILRGHFTGGARLGVHSTSPDNFCRWVSIDIDLHDDGGMNSEAKAAQKIANFAAATDAWEWLREQGFNPLLEDSNGDGGFHLSVVFGDPVPAYIAFAFAREIANRAAAFGIDPPETFPKQPRVPEGGYGNWLRLPGQHPKRPHFSKIWDGTRWLEGHDAIDALLATTGDDPDLIPQTARQAPEPMESPSETTDVLDLPEGVELNEAISIAKTHLESLPRTQCGTRSCHDRTYFAAHDLLIGCCLSPTESMPLLRAWADQGTHEWTDVELWHKLDLGAHKAWETKKLRKRMRGYLLEDVTELTLQTIGSFGEGKFRDKHRCPDTQRLVVLDRERPGSTGQIFKPCDNQATCEVCRDNHAIDRTLAMGMDLVMLGRAAYLTILRPDAAEDLQTAWTKISGRGRQRAKRSGVPWYQGSVKVVGHKIHAVTSVPLDETSAESLSIEDTLDFYYQAQLRADREKYRQPVTKSPALVEKPEKATSRYEPFSEWRETTASEKSLAKAAKVLGKPVDHDPTRQVPGVFYGGFLTPDGHVDRQGIRDFYLLANRIDEYGTAEAVRIHRIIQRRRAKLASACVNFRE